MNIKLFGTGALVGKSFSACALIDDAILFDCPNGLVRKLRQADVDFSKINTVIISHFHADHDWDLPFLLWEYNRIGRNSPLTIITPQGFAERYKPLCDACWPGMFFFEKAIENIKPTVLESSDNKTFEIDGYSLQTFKMDHANCDAYGFKITKEGDSVAFTGDSAMCENVIKLIDGAKIAFIDTTGTPPPNTKPLHFDIPDFEKLKEQTPSVRLIPVHMSDETRQEMDGLGFETPNDNDVFGT